MLLHISENIQVGNKALILAPEYVAGKVGVVCGRETLLDVRSSDRWLIRLDFENMVVSLNPSEFQVISQSQG
ncbi:hypothetical protein [Fischerella sp.]|jgi:hypothetical protein|uniref:hypothetical protein n=1 Tax=Fischerella sp. TaxID=1191 RepID=UPI00345BF3E9